MRGIPISRKVVADGETESESRPVANSGGTDREFMEKAVEEARKCQSEDGRANPKVGAVVVKDGKELVAAYRGEQREGEHAEFTALETGGCRNCWRDGLHDAGAMYHPQPSQGAVRNPID